LGPWATTEQAVKDWIAPRRRIVVEWLPPYAPDLNPVEAVWSHTKYGDLANHAPDSIQALEQSFLSSMVRTKGQSRLLSAFFRAAGLKV
jgi:transposase